MISVYLNKEQQKRFNELARRLGVTDYRVLKCLVEIFLADPFLFLEVQAKLKNAQISDKI